MAVESFVTRWLKAVRPPSRETPNAALLAQKRRQRRLIQRTLAAILLATAGWSVYSYLAGAPARARAEAALGVKMTGPGTYDQAIQHLDRAIHIWPEYAEAYLDRAFAEHEASQRGPALADLDKALDLDPSLTRAYNQRGQIYFESGDTQKAIREFTRSLQVNPTVDGYYQRGEAYEKLGDHRKAIDDLGAAIGEFREAPYAYRARAVARRNAGDRQGAQADEENAKRLESGQSSQPDVLLAPLRWRRSALLP